MNLKSISTRIILKLKKWFKRKGYINLAAESQALVHLAVHLVQAVKTITIDTVLDDVVAALLSSFCPPSQRPSAGSSSSWNRTYPCGSSNSK